MIPPTLPRPMNRTAPSTAPEPVQHRSLHTDGLETGLIVELRCDPWPEPEVASLQEARRRLRELRRDVMQAERQLASTRRRRAWPRQLLEVRQIVMNAPDSELADAVIRRNRVQICQEEVRRDRLREARQAEAALSLRLTPRVLVDMAQVEWQRLKDTACPDRNAEFQRLFRQNRVIVRLESILRHLHPPEAGLLARPWIQRQLGDLTIQGRMLVAQDATESDSAPPPA